MRQFQLNPSLPSHTMAILLTICLVVIAGPSINNAQENQAAGKAAKEQQDETGNVSPTDMESLEKQIEDAAAREAESLEGAELWDADSDHFTHRVSYAIEVLQANEANVHLVGYCLDVDGNLLAACSGKETQEIRVFTPAGKRLKTWPLSITPLQIASAPNGHVYVAGQESILVLDSDGQELWARDCPYLEQAKAEFELEKAKLETEIKASVEQQLLRFRSRLDDLQEKRQKLLDKPQETLTESEQRRLRIFERSIATFESLIAKQENQSWSDEIAEKLAARLRARSNVCSLAVTSSAVYLTAPGKSSFGFDIWRGNHKLEDWKIICSGLSGCCGNMDVAAGKENVIVAENSKFRVLVLDDEGNEQLNFGKADRDGKTGFSGCCNPMNVCVPFTSRVTSDKPPAASIYTAESGTGLIKRFDSSGKLLDHVGRVQLRSGCKNVSIEVSLDGSHLFMLDLPRSRIVVLKRSDSGSDE